MSKETPWKKEYMRAKKTQEAKETQVGKNASKELCKSMGWVYEEDVVESNDDSE